MSDAAATATGGSSTTSKPLSTTLLRHPLAITKTWMEFKASFGRVHSELFEVLARYEVSGSIANGAYGYVCAATDSEAEPTEEGEPKGVAIKKIVRLFEGQRNWVCGSRELQMMLFFNHPNIMSAQDLFVPLGEHNNLTLSAINSRRENFDEVYIVMDLMDQTLRDFIDSQEPVDAGINPVTGKVATASGKVNPMPLQHRSYLLFQILQGLGYMHRASVMHRDLKPENILIDSYWNAKICDFGQGRGIGDGTQGQSYATVAGTCTQWYASPENLTITQDMDSNIVIDKSIFHAQDVWSVGCIAAEMLIGRPLFEVNERGDLPQLKSIIGTLGMPTHDELKALNRESDTPLEAMEIYLKEWSRAGLVPSESKLREILKSPLGEEEESTDEINMIIAMLHYDMNKRITIEDAIRNPVFKPFIEDDQDPVDLLGKPTIFPFTPKKDLETLPQARELIWNLFTNRHPEVPELIEALKINEAHDAAKKAAAAAQEEEGGAPPAPATE